MPTQHLCNILHNYSLGRVRTGSVYYIHRLAYNTLAMTIMCLHNKHELRSQAEEGMRVRVCACACACACACHIS